jgi:lysophospholipase L1-like esterase
MTYGPVNATSYPTQLQGLLGTKYRVINKGVNSNRISDMQARFTADVTHYRPRYVLILGGINDILVDESAETLEAGLKGLYSSTRAIEATPIAIRITPFGNHAGWTTAREAVRVTVNSWIGTTRVRYVDAESALGDFSSPGQPKIRSEYDNGGGLHLNATGNGVLAHEVYMQGFGG